MTVALRATVIRMALLAAMIAGCGFQLWERSQRYWHPMPTVPYRDVWSEHWMYGALDHLSKPGDALAIWGWAAHVWVYSGLVPATRESTTEFAIRDWGPDHYYRQRFLRDLAAAKPPLLLEAVGPHEFFAFDRRTQGIESWPELAALVERDFQRVVDDGNAGLYVNRAYLAQCCLLAQPQHWDLQDGSVFGRDAVAPDTIALQRLQPYMIGSFLQGDAGMGAARVTLEYPGREATAVVLGFMFGPTHERGTLAIELIDAQGEAIADCRAEIDRAGGHAIQGCVMSLPQGRRQGPLTVLVHDRGSAVGQWIAVTPPLLVLDPQAQ